MKKPETLDELRISSIIFLCGMDFAHCWRPLVIIVTLVVNFYIICCQVAPLIVVLLAIWITVDSFVFVGNNFRGLRKTCIFVDLWFHGFDEVSMPGPLINLLFVETFNFMVHVYPGNPRKLVSTVTHLLTFIWIHYGSAILYTWVRSNMSIRKNLTSFHGKHHKKICEEEDKW